MLLQIFIGYVTIMHQCQPLPIPYGARSESEIPEAECTLGPGQYE